MKPLRAARGQGGQSLVEFALVAPIVLFFLLALVDFGIAIDRRLVLDHAAREGARYAAVGGYMLTTGTPATAAEIEDYTSDQGQGVPDGVAVCYQDANGDGTLGNTGDNVRVTVEYTHDFVTGFTSFFDLSLGSIVMDTSAHARLELAVASPDQCL